MIERLAFYRLAGMGSKAIKQERCRGVGAHSKNGRNNKKKMCANSSTSVVPFISFANATHPSQPAGSPKKKVVLLRIFTHFFFVVLRLLYTPLFFHPDTVCLLFRLHLWPFFFFALFSISTSEKPTNARHTALHSAAKVWRNYGATTKHGRRRRRLTLTVDLVSSSANFLSTCP